MLTRNIRIQEDFVDQLFNSSEKRLARVLLFCCGSSADPSTLAFASPCEAWSRHLPLRVELMGTISLFGSASG